MKTGPTDPNTTQWLTDVLNNVSEGSFNVKNDLDSNSNRAYTVYILNTVIDLVTVLL